MSTLRWMQSTQPMCRIQNDISNFKIANNNLAAILISTLCESTINLHNQIHNSTAAALSTLGQATWACPAVQAGHRMPARKLILECMGGCKNELESAVST